MIKNRAPGVRDDTEVQIEQDQQVLVPLLDLTESAPAHFEQGAVPQVVKAIAHHGHYQPSIDGSYFEFPAFIQNGNIRNYEDCWYIFLKGVQCFAFHAKGLLSNLV